MKRFFTALLATWWASPLCLLSCTLLSAASMAGWILTAQRPAAATLNGVLRVAPSFLLPAAAVFGLLSLAALIGALCKKRWRRALGTFLAGGAACGIGLAALMAVVMLRFFWDDDHTADDWSVPEGLEVAVPGEASWPDDPPQSGNDPYRNAVMAALSQEGTDDATLTATAPSLARLAAEHPDLLKRYFTLHPAWRVFPDRGGLRATRVMGQDGRWPYPLNGYFSQLFAPDGMRWQVRLSVILEGNGWFWPRGATRMKEGETREIALTGNQVKESYTEIEAGGMRLEIFEQSERNERRLTKALLRLLEEELQPLAASPTEETLRTLLPPGSIVGGEAGIDLRDGSQGGIYEGYFRANPGEPGLAWLKAYEVTTETPLSERRLAEDSAVRLGWSDDPAELFPGSVHFTIYEGNWDHYYAARFELWFRPDATGEARKLAEKTYKIQGWMR
jgi:hypothetical protein